MANAGQPSENGLYFSLQIITFSDATPITLYQTCKKYYNGSVNIRLSGLKTNLRLFEVSVTPVVRSVVIVGYVYTIR